MLSNYHKDRLNRFVERSLTSYYRQTYSIFSWDVRLSFSFWSRAIASSFCLSERFKRWTSWRYSDFNRCVPTSCILICLSTMASWSFASFCTAYGYVWIFFLLFFVFLIISFQITFTPKFTLTFNWLFKLPTLCAILSPMYWMSAFSFSLSRNKFVSLSFSDITLSYSDTNFSQYAVVLFNCLLNESREICTEYIIFWTFVNLCCVRLRKKKKNEKKINK